MRKSVLLLIAVFLSANGFCQIAMNLDMNRSVYLQYENIYCRLTIKNVTGHSLVFGNNPKLSSSIRFVIETNAKENPTCVDSNYNPLTNKVFAAGETDTITIPLSKLYRIISEGEYHIKAVIKHSQLEKSYESNVADFKVVRGTLVWETTVGVPSVDGENKEGGKIAHRKYLLYSFFDGNNKIYCVRVDDDKYVYGLARLGVDIGVSKPECITDRLSRLHILLQSTPTIFCYYVYDTECKLEEKDFFKKTDTSTPTLIISKEINNVQVAGGIRAVEGEDYSIEKDNK